MKFIVRDIERAVCQRFNLTTAEMRSPSRALRIARPRQIAMYLARTLTAASYPQIGRHFGGRDHSTIWHGRRKIEAMLRETNSMAHDVEGVRDILLTLTPHRELVGAAVSSGLLNTAGVAP